MTILVFSEPYFVQYQRHSFKFELFEKSKQKSGIIGFFSDLILDCVLMNSNKSKTQINNENEDSFDLSEIDEKINALKKNLQQTLNTLNYLFKMESNFKTIDSEVQLDELYELRTILREKACKITQELLHHKTIKINNILVDYIEVG